jgi:hypothetical protein
MTQGDLSSAKTMAITSDITAWFSFCSLVSEKRLTGICHAIRFVGLVRTTLGIQCMPLKVT